MDLTAEKSDGGGDVGSHIPPARIGGPLQEVLAPHMISQMNFKIKLLPNLKKSQSASNAITLQSWQIKSHREKATYAQILTRFAQGQHGIL